MPDERLPLRDEFFAGRVPRVDMDCELFRCKLDLGAKRFFSFDFFFSPEVRVEESESLSPSLSVRTWLIAEPESEKLSFFFIRTLSFNLDMRERGLSRIERSTMLADMLFLMKVMLSRTSPRSLSAFPLLSTNWNQLKTREKVKVNTAIFQPCFYIMHDWGEGEDKLEGRLG